MSKLKIALFQMNSTVGDLKANADQLLSQINIAKQNGANIFVAPELAISGYPPEDLLLRPAFYQQCQYQLNRLLEIDNITLIIGCPYTDGKINFNSAFVINNGAIIDRYDKMVLPNHGVFDELRYFKAGNDSLVVEINQVKCGILICEDMWGSMPAKLAKDNGAELLVVINSSPFQIDKQDLRLQIAKKRVMETSLPLVYVNQIGGQDELVFDGASFVLNSNAELVFQAPAFVTDLFYYDYEQFASTQSASNKINPYPIIEEQVYQALKLALKDYIHKNGFTKVVIGLSGGIDSALTLAVAVDCLGAKNVTAIMMPSKFTADISIIDAVEMVKLTGVTYEQIEIESIFNEFNQQLSPLFKGLDSDLTEENLQARIRGTLLMAVSNKFGYLVITTSNKSEMATGYGTLYGDMAGGFALLKDVPKTLVYRLANWRNQLGKIIPARIITRPPSAELRDDQCDQDSLPEYDILDAIVEYLVDQKLTSDEIVALGYSKEDVSKIAHLLKINEYKRRQAAVGPKITANGFTRDWRYPNTHKFKY